MSVPASQPRQGGRVSSEARPGWAPAGQIAQLLGLSLQRLRDLARDGYVPKAERGQYALVGTVQGYVKFLRDPERRSAQVQAENSLKAVRQQEIEQRIARRAHELAETEEVISVISEIIDISEAETAGLPTAVTNDPALRRRISSEIDGVFARSRSRLAERAASLRKMGTAVALPAEEDA